MFIIQMYPLGDRPRLLSVVKLQPVMLQICDDSLTTIRIDQSLFKLTSIINYPLGDGPRLVTMVSNSG